MHENATRPNKLLVTKCKKCSAVIGSHPEYAKTWIMLNIKLGTT
jgi:hypothetical protein